MASYWCIYSIRYSVSSHACRLEFDTKFNTTYTGWTLPLGMNVTYVGVKVISRRDVTDCVKLAILTAGYFLVHCDTTDYHFVYVII